MPLDAPADARAGLAARLAPWRRLAACGAVCACAAFGLAAFVAVLIAHRHDLAMLGAARQAGAGAVFVVAAATGVCAAACAWLELGARGRPWTERLDERLGLQGALCAAVDGRPTRLSDALARDVLGRVTRGAMASVACARLWPAAFVLSGAGAAWLASESSLARGRDGVPAPGSTAAALADELQRAALESSSAQVRANLASAAAAARRLAAAESAQGGDELRATRAALIEELRALELAARADSFAFEARVASEASVVRHALEAQIRAEDARRDGARRGDRAQASDARTGADQDFGAADGSDATLGSGRPGGGTGGTGLASGASGGTISTPEPSRGPLLAPTVLETLPAHEAAWLSTWAARARTPDAPPR
jgi:hypothetical protein